MPGVSTYNAVQICGATSEVKLQDGRVIVVHVKRKYERQRQSPLPYDANSIQFRSGTLAFMASASQRVVVKSHQPLGCLDQHGADWFLVVSGQGPFGIADESPTRWGNDFSTMEQRLAKLADGEFVPVNWELAPSELRYLNLVGNLFYPEFPAWNGKILTLAMKSEFRAKHGILTIPQITRPLRMAITQESRT